MPSTSRLFRARPRRRARVTWPERLEPRRLLAAEPIISEFLASNDGALSDAGGGTPDYIELHNAGDEGLDLQGWYLTDDPTDLTKWSFPSTTPLGAQQFLVVFASGDDMTDADGIPHTNFELNAAGEYVALVRPDGVTIASQFGSIDEPYPEQHEDISYGVRQLTQHHDLVPSGASGDVLVPDAEIPQWNQPEYQPDASWRTAGTPIGYDVNSITTGGGGEGGTTLLSIDINSRAEQGLTQPLFESFVIGGTGAQTADITRSYGDIVLTLSGVDNQYDDRLRPEPVDSGDFTESALLRDFVFSRDVDGGGLDVLIEGLEPGQYYKTTVWSFDDVSTPTRRSDWYANGVLGVDGYEFDGADVPPSPASDDIYRFSLTAAADAEGRILISGRDQISLSAGGNATFGVFLNALRIETAEAPALPVPVLRLDFNDGTSGEVGDANTEEGFSSFTLADNGAEYDGVRVTLTAIGGAFLDDRDRVTPTDNPPFFTQDQLYDDFIFANGTNDGNGLEILIEGLTPGQNYDLVLWSFDTGSGWQRTSYWVETSTGVELTVDDSYSFGGNALPSQNGLNTIQKTVTASADGTLQLRGVRNGGTSHGVFVNALQLSASGFGDLVETDLEQEMHQLRTSAYLRIPFDAPDTDLDLMTLGVMYDDGFVAYLNGHEVARRNVPGVAGEPLAFDAEASSSRSSGEALTTESIDVSPSIDLLVLGDHGGQGNVLAVHGLNFSADDGDFLLQASLSATAIEDVGSGYFEPSPGAPNDFGFAGFVGDTSFSVDRGFHDAPFEVEITADTPGSEIYYTTNGSAPSPSNPSATPYAAPVPIATTTTLRAAAFLDDHAPSNVDTQTYVFLEDVLTQNPLASPGDVVYPTVWQGNATADFEMDPEVVAQWDDHNPNNLDFGIREALRSLPTMSIVLDHEDLWGASTGIYNHSTSTGDSWQRPGSIEYFDPETGEQFQYDAGIQIHGGASRDNARLKKHSFRLIFNDEFGGPTALPYPLFDNSDLDEINTVVMRASFTDAFATRTQTDRYSPFDSQYTRDVWMRDTQIDMGHPSAASTFVHLYINGLYWGMYSPAERPDDAFQQAYGGGEREDWDVIKDFNELFRGNRDAWEQMFSLADQLSGPDPDAIYHQMIGSRPDGTPDPSIPNLLDVDNLIDYMLLHFYGGAEDWPHHNWYAARNRVGETKGFQFFVWDQEIVLDGRFRDLTEVGTASNHDHTPAELYSRLRQSPEFRQRFIDRVQLHMFNGGALTTEANQERWMARADQVEAAIIGESARWGDAREGESVQVDSGQPNRIVPTMTVDLWRAERDNVHDNYFPGIRTLLLQDLEADGLFTSMRAPELNQHGGVVPSGFSLEIVDPASPPVASHTIYYTTDGADPRAVGGGVAGGAIPYSGAVTLTESIELNARIRDEDTGRWSPLIEVDFVINHAASGSLAVTELNYNPADPTAEELTELPEAENDDFEFIELRNVGDQLIDLTGVRFTDGVEFDFTGSAVTELSPGEYVLVARDAAAIAVRYGDAVAGHVAGQYSGNLNNDGETIALVDRLGGMIHEFEYGDGGAWPGRPDGSGATLVVIDPAGDYADQANWRSGFEYLGTPAAESLSEFPTVVINEVLAHTDPPDRDTVELYNPTGSAIDIGGWYLSDSSDRLKKFRIPDGTTIDAGGFVLFDESHFNSSMGTDPGDFAFSGKQGDDVWLMVADQDDRLTLFADHVDFIASLNGESFGRWPDATGELYPMAEKTLGAENSGPRVGPLVISEVMYGPDPTLAVGDPSDLEFVEIHNPTEAPIDLVGWELSGVDYSFPAAAVLESGGVLVVIGFNPNNPDNAQRLAEFRAAYGIDESVSLVGGFDGRLDNGGERVRLLRPDEPPMDEPDFTPLVLEDEVRYDNTAPWPTSADGGGMSLHRVTAEDWGNDAASWEARLPTPGAVAPGAAPPRVLSVTTNASLVDPPNLPAGQQPTSWARQRSDIRTIEVTFDKPVQLVADDLTLINLGVDAPNDPDQEIALTQDQISVDGNVVTIRFGQYELPNGVYQLIVGDGVRDLDGVALDGDGDGSAGGAFVHSGDSANKFYKLLAELSGDEGVSIFDFTTFSYWFGQTSIFQQGPAPKYVDFNDDDGISIFDFNDFAANFGAAVTLVPPPLRSEGPPSAPILPDASAADRPPVDLAHDAALDLILIEWSRHEDRFRRRGWRDELEERDDRSEDENLETALLRRASRQA